MTCAASFKTKGAVPEMRVMYLRKLAPLLLIAMHPAAVSADELPKELLLRCEGKLHWTTTATWSLSHDDVFNITLRLKDGSIIDIDNNVPQGEGCSLVNDEIQCELNKLIPVRELNSIEKRHSTVLLKRETGELRIFLEKWRYSGTKISGTPSYHLEELRTGICRTVGKPLF